MKPPFLKPSLPVALASIAVFALAGIPGVRAEPEPDTAQAEPESDKAPVDPMGEYDLVENKDHPGYIARVYKWTKDITRFDAGLRILAEKGEIPKEEALKKRLENQSGDLEIITDGYGGVVDFNAAKGTVQYEANKKFANGQIDWEFELAGDTEIHDDKSTSLVPEIARIPNDGKGKKDTFRFWISIEESDDGPFKAGDRVRLQATIDDFSRFRKGYDSGATGVVAIYYLEEGPNPVFELKLDEAEVTLIKRADPNAVKSERGKPEDP